VYDAGGRLIDSLDVRVPDFAALSARELGGDSES
jgi:hypothetical protein